MPRREDLYLAELVEATEEITRYIDQASDDRWYGDSMLRSAVLHQLTIVGEVARALPEDLRSRYPDVPWAKMKAFHNIAVHEYFALDKGLVWRIASKEIPELKRQALTVLQAEFPDIARYYAPDSD